MTERTEAILDGSPLRGKRIVVTGAAGFLGQHLASAARTRGATVVPVVRAPRDTTERTTEAIMSDPRVLDGVNLLVHSAAVRHRHGATPDAYRASNVELTEALLRASAHRVNRFVYVSSVGVYGFPRILPVSETTRFAPVTLYSWTKLEAERLVRRLAPQFGLDYTIVRPTIIYGPGDTNGMLDKLARMLRARRYLIVGSGENRLHHTFVDDVVDGIFALGSDERGRNDAFIVAGPETITLTRLSTLVAATLGTTVPPLRVPLFAARAAATLIDVAAYQRLAFVEREPPINHEKLDVMTVSIEFDSTRARAAGFTPRVRYEEGIRRTLGRP